MARAVARGSTYQEIADELGIGLQTVLTHAGSIRRKLVLRNKVEITNWVHRHESAP